jgi:NhaP-type Na+/H+ or K+/H+ antiporter
MQELGSDVNLYALVFGESVLNDAVCFQLFSSSSKIVSAHSTSLRLWITYVSFYLERADGNLSLQVCFWE